MIQQLRWKIKKLYHTFRLYGFNRAYVKLYGRTRSSFLPKLPLSFSSPEKIVGIVGCGQFSTSTIGFFLKKNKGNIIAGCFDIDSKQSQSFASYYRCRQCNSIDELLAIQGLQVVYIASNHSTHTPYAIKALNLQKIVFVEKPLSTSFGQLQDLLNTIQVNSLSKIYIGYNRPHSPAIKELNNFIRPCIGPLTLSCFITGHKIGPDHWYRAPEEGLRICGNLGHWLDLSVHLLWIKPTKPRFFKITASVSNNSEPDDNLSLSMISDLGDLIVITLTSRDEPFEGINETINLQCDEVICKIDDFRKMTIWKGNECHHYRYFRKNVGHERSILQPFETPYRIWSEVEVSTRLMLTIMEMIYSKKSNFVFDITDPDLI